jgi:UDPglucose 6-dehydrogenase
MNIAVIGTGYVGLVTGAIFAAKGSTVTCVDIDEKKIEKLLQNIIPIYEPGLQELVEHNQSAGRLSFSTSTADAIQTAQVIFIAVGTPSDVDGRADLQFVKQVAREIGMHMKDYKAVVNKSTVPVGTGNLVESIIREHYDGDFDVVSNPEFLREGTAINDCLNPDRIVIGNAAERAKKVMEELYESFDCPILFTDVKSAEMIKYASNAMLATEISFINSVANICDRVGADVTKVAEGMRLDGRIGKRAFLDAGCGYGGSCFPKDVKALIRTAREVGFEFSLLDAVEDLNEYQKRAVVKRLMTKLPTLEGKTIAIWGLAFKPRTDDMREAVSLVVVDELVRNQAKIQAFDPVAQEVAKRMFVNGTNGSISYSATPIEAASDADALLILTEWDEFTQIDLALLKSALRTPIVIDGRNVFDPAIMKSHGFDYQGMGRA